MIADMEPLELVETGPRALVLLGTARTALIQEAERVGVDVDD